MSKQLLPATEAARRLGLSVHTVRRMTREMRIPHIRLGRRRLYDPDALDTFVQDRAVAVTDEPDAA